MVQYLVENGAKVTHVDDNENTALFLASGFHRLAIVKYLIAQGADVNFAQKSGGWTPLMYAIGKGKDLAMVKYLVEQGADINSKSYSGKTSLSLAQNSNLKDIVQFLKEHIETQ